MGKEKNIFLSEIPFFLCCLGQVAIHRAVVRKLRSSGFKIERAMVKQRETLQKILPAVVLSPFSFQRHTAAGLVYLSGICERGFEELYWGTELVW